MPKLGPAHKLLHRDVYFDLPFHVIAPLRYDSDASRYRAALHNKIVALRLGTLGRATTSLV